MKRRRNSMFCIWQILSLALYLFPLRLFAQDITGVWSGYLQTTGSKMHYELGISETDNKLTGYSITIFIIDGIENTGVKSIKLKNKKGKISFEDDKLIYDNYTTPSKPVKLFGDLSLKEKDSLMILEGTFITRSNDIRYLNENVFKGSVYLQKQKNYTNTKLVLKLGEMNLLNTLSFIRPPTKEIVSAPVMTKKTVVVTPKIPTEKTAPSVTTTQSPKKITPLPKGRITAADIATRKTEIIQTVFFTSDSLLMSLYDNGQVDGDTVSVALNGKIILANKGLTANAISQTIYLGALSNDSLLLVMYAENLGTIPPNTGLLVLQDGDNRYEIRFAGDLQKNSAILLKRKH